MKAHRLTFASIGLGLLLTGCLAGLSGPAAGAERPPGTSAVAPGREAAASLERRLSDLQREHRIRRRAAALLSEVALFDEGAVLGRSVQVLRLMGGPTRPPTDVRTFETETRLETVGIGGDGEGRVTLRTGLEELEEEIRGLEMRLRAFKKGGRRP